MKNNKIEQLIDALYSVSMTNKEKSHMRRQLLAVTYAKAQPSPYFFSFAKLQRGFAVALIVVLTVGSISKPAAAGALPGDFLYAVKLMHEEIEAATISKPELKVINEIKRTETRIKEASELAVKKNLDTKKKEQISEDIKKHTAKVKKEIAEVQEKDPLRALELNNQFKVAMETNAEVLKEQNESQEDEFEKTEDETENVEELEEEAPLKEELDNDKNSEETEKIKDVSEINELDIALGFESEVKKETEASDKENIDSLLHQIEADINEAKEQSEKSQKDIVNIVVQPADISKDDVQENENPKALKTESEEVKEEALLEADLNLKALVR